METTIKGSYKNGGKTVTDATGDLSLRITVADIDAAVCRSPHECVIAQAIMRQTRAPWVEVRNDVIYVGTSETEGVRYLHTTMSKEQVRYFDETGNFAPCPIELQAPKGKRAIGARAGEKCGSNKRSGVRRLPTRTAAVPA